MKTSELSISTVKPVAHTLNTLDFQQLADVPPALTWFANIDNPQTRRAYQNDVKEFMVFTGIDRPEQFRVVTRAHLLAWRRDLEERKLSGSTIRRKLAALSSLFDYLCEVNAIPAIRSKASGARKRKAKKVRRRQSGTTRRAPCWACRTPPPYEAGETAPSSLPSSITACAAPSCAR